MNQFDRHGCLLAALATTPLHHHVRRPHIRGGLLRPQVQAARLHSTQLCQVDAERGGQRSVGAFAITKVEG